MTDEPEVTPVEVEHPMKVEIEKRLNVMEDRLKDMSGKIKKLEARITESEGGRPEKAIWPSDVDSPY